MFGTEPKVGLTSSAIPVEIIERLESEDDLLGALSVPLNSADDLPPQPDDQLPASQPDDTSPPQPDDQADRMVKRSRIELQAGNIGDNVALPVPMVDRAGGTLATS